VQKATGRPVMTVNEGRRLLGLMEIEGGDEIAQPTPGPVVSPPAPGPPPSPDAEGMDPGKALGFADAEVAFQKLLSLIPEGAA
jgi:hypothetical protein